MTSARSRSPSPGRSRMKAMLCGVVGAAVSLLVTACATKEPSPSAGAAGSWSGSTASPGRTPVGLRFVLQERAGALTGKLWVEDPETRVLLEDAELTGSRDGSHATWTTSTDLVVTGQFTGDHFVGTLDFPPDYPLEFHRADVVLDR
jgi:hypothetical protein